MKLISAGVKKILFLCVLTLTLFSKQSLSREHSVVVGFSLGPYATVQGRGMLVDIAKAVFETNSDKARFVFMSNKEALRSFEDGLFDVIGLTTPTIGSAYYSETLIVFKNKVYALKRSKVKVDSIEDLKHLRVVGFSGASKFLGKSFHDAMVANSQYTEIANQENQLQMLYNGEADVIIADEKIFHFYKKKLQKQKIIKKDNNEEIVAYDLLAPSNYVAGFLNKEDRDKFNKGLKIIRKNGVYDEIEKKYDRLLDIY